MLREVSSAENWDSSRLRKGVRKVVSSSRYSWISVRGDLLILLLRVLRYSLYYSFGMSLLTMYPPIFSNFMRRVLRKKHSIGSDL